MPRQDHGSPSRRELMRSSQSGVTLLEVLIVVALALVVLVPFFGWVTTSLWQQAEAQRTNTESFALGLTNTYFSRDVATALVVATTEHPGGVINDCPDSGGDDGDGGEPRLGMITTSKERIVYSLVEAGDGTKELWRRVCPNVSDAADQTLNDPAVLNSNTAGDTTGTRLAKRLDGLVTSCAGGTLSCPQVILRAEFPDDARPAVLRATRRVNRYAPPGTPPVARISFVPDGTNPKLLNFSSAGSYDPRGLGLQSYRWTFPGVPGCTPVTAPTASCEFPLGEFQVNLQVVSLEGEVGDAVETIIMRARRPDVKFQGVPYTSRVKNVESTYTIDFTPYDGTSLAEYRVSWGDGTVDTWPADSGLTPCSGQDTCQVQFDHTYTETGFFRIQATAIDTGGQSRTRIATVNVGSEVLYVSKTNPASVNAVGCGSPQVPCNEIQYGLARAAAESKIEVLVTEGSYGRFDVRGGIDVRGGLTSTYQPGGGVSLVSAYLDVPNNRYSAIQATNVSEATTISGLRVEGPELAASAALPPPANATAQAIVVLNSTNLTFDSLNIQGKKGPEATGMLIDNSRDITLSNSTIYSGETLGGSNSAYGIRIYRSNAELPASSLTVTGGDITAHFGAFAKVNTAGAPATGALGCDGSNGANASGPASPGGGGAGAGCGASTTLHGGAGGAGGNYSSGGSAGSSGVNGGGAGGAGGCGSLFGCDPAPVGGGKGAAGAAGAVPLVTVGGGPVGNGDPGLITPTPNWSQAVDRGPAGGGGGSGKGGGGGGGGKSASASGGGGGGGGEGGRGAAGGSTPGYAGGGSFGIYAINSIVTVNGNATITARDGRDGGAGSNGGTGGAGGKGGNGGSESCCSASAGAGGGGGSGGGGGAGASGGPGGPSIAIFQSGIGDVLATVSGAGKDVNLAVAATAAPGGPGGTGGNRGAGGGGGTGAGTGETGNNGAKGADGWTGRLGLRYLVWDNGPAAAP